MQAEIVLWHKNSNRKVLTVTFFDDNIKSDRDSDGSEFIIIMKKNSKFFSGLLSVITVLVVFCVWFFVSNYSDIKASLLPTPQSVLDAFITISRDGYKGHTFLQHIGASLGRLMTAFLLSVVIGVPLGLAGGANRFVRAVVNTFIEFYRPLPPLAYYTLLVLWFGIGNESKVILLFLACLAPIYVSCSSAVIKVNENYINCAKTLGASRGKIFTRVIMPACLPDIFTGLKTAIGVGYTTLVAAEMVAAKSGIGWIALDAGNYLRSDVVFCIVFVMGITGMLIDLVLKTIEKKVVYWNGKQ